MSKFVGSALVLYCSECGEKGLPWAALARDGVRCPLCGRENWEPFREGWDESD